MSQAIVMYPIGYVENDVEEWLPPEEIAQRRSRIIIDPKLADGLLRIEQAEQLLILYYFHRAGEVRLQLHPRDDKSKPVHGVFATRTQYRPNHIGATIVRLLSVEGNVLTVEGLDAMNGSPVLDIKPAEPPYGLSPQKDEKA